MTMSTATRVVGLGLVRGSFMGLFFGRSREGVAPGSLLGNEAGILRPSATAQFLRDLLARCQQSLEFFSRVERD